MVENRARLSSHRKPSRFVERTYFACDHTKGSWAVMTGSERPGFKKPTSAADT